MQDLNSNAAPGATSGAPVRQFPAEWDAYAERLREKLPAAPEGLLNGYVRWAPWVAIVFGVLGVLGLLALFGIGAVLSPFLLLGGASGVATGAGLFLALILGIVTAALEVAGGYLMLKMRLTGWWLLAAGLVVSALNSLFSMSLFGLLITALIAYIHLLVKPRYA
ncbi:MAG TPA: hypothetical protein VHS99_19710 [Chloroflexota bacterium]|nr:hypothetical protein [Chloroflexota bacterium]